MCASCYVSSSKVQPVELQTASGHVWPQFYIAFEIKASEIGGDFKKLCWK